MPTHTPTRADGIGAPLPRTEDRRLLTGQGRYAGDVFPDGLCHAALVRSPHAHARIGAIDTSRAAALPGVLAVLTGADAAADGMGAIPHNPDWKGPPDVELRLPPGFEVYLTPNTPLPAGTVRYVGEAVALVVAETAALAADAAELVDVDWQPLPTVVDARAAMGPEAPPIWPDRPGNLALTCEVGDQAATDRAFAAAAHVVTLDAHIHRVTGSPMEPRAVVGAWDAATGRYTLYAASGRGAVQTRERLALTLGVPLESCRAIFGDMGGNFGTRNAFSPEFALMPWAAKRIGRPVKWTADRRECFLSDYQARDLASRAELALDAEGNFLALRGENVMNLGAYTVYFWPLRKGLSMMQGVYRIPAVYFRGHAVFSNTPPVAVYRSAGRPEAIYMIERLIDLAAAEHGFDRVALRRRNLIPSESMPFANGVGVTYDSGDYPAGLAKALELADYDALRAQQAAARAEGRLVGIGIGLSVEPCVSNMGYLNVAYPPEDRAKPGFHIKSGAGELASIKIDPMGRVTAIVSSAPSGQGHDTLVAQVIADELGVKPHDISVVTEMDTFTRPWTISSGNYSSRFASAGISAFAEASRKLRDKLLTIAAHQFKVPKGELRIGGGRIVHTGEGGRSLTYREVSGLAHWNPGALPDGMEPGLQVTHLFNYAPSKVVDEQDRVNSSNAYGFIAEVALVEVDRETGEVKILRYVSVHDCGTIINPQRVEGQVYGGVMHGIGGALYEELAYDDNGQFLAGSFMDYLCPTAMEAPTLDIAHVSVPSPFSTLGTKGCGEGSAMTAPAVLANGVNDALAPLGAGIHELPLSPHRVWQALESSVKPAPKRRAGKASPVRV